MATFGIKSVISVVDRATEPLERVNKAIKNTFSPIRKLHNSTRQLSKELGIPKVGRAFTSLKKSVGSTISEVRKLGTEFVIVGGLAAGFMGATMYSAANAADTAGKTAERLSISADAWTRLSYAGEMAGVSSDKLRQGLARLGDMSTKAARGGKEARWWFHQFGISVRDQNGELKSADSLLLEASNKFSLMEDSTNKTRMAMGLLGQNLGVELLPLLNAGPEAIRAFSKEAEKMGLTFSPQQIAMSAAFNDSISRLKTSIKGASYAIGFELIPLFQPWIDDVRELVVANRELIATRVGDAIEWLRDRLEKATPRLREMWNDVKSLATRVEDLVQGLGGWAEVLPYILGFLAVLKLAPLIGSVTSLTSAILGLGLALLTTPIGWIVLGIAGLTVIFKHFWDNCEGFRQFWKDLWDDIVGVFNWAEEKLGAKKTTFLPSMDHNSGYDALGLPAPVAAATTAVADVAKKVETPDIPSATAQVETLVDDSALDQHGANIEALKNQLLEGLSIEQAKAIGNRPEHSSALQSLHQTVQNQAQEGQVKVVFENVPPNVKIEPTHADMEVNRNIWSGTYAGMRMGTP